VTETVEGILDRIHNKAKRTVGYRGGRVSKWPSTVSIKRERDSNGKLFWHKHPACQLLHDDVKDGIGSMKPTELYKTRIWACFVQTTSLPRNPQTVDCSVLEREDNWTVSSEMETWQNKYNVLPIILLSYFTKSSNG
jgi:hypothetical protein